jgi:hypothetical protein
MAGPLEKISSYQNNSHLSTSCQKRERKEL